MPQNVRLEVLFEQTFRVGLSKGGAAESAGVLRRRRAPGRGAVGEGLRGLISNVQIAEMIVESVIDNDSSQDEPNIRLTYFSEVERWPKELLVCK